ncbi:hypothetical protein EX895_000968 [Sporisorium graminicola]|uniref:Uncharacterized protein n=1 Tax=Sporisorium graminicola TaxID=280036 RepID=A0A4V6YER9_9BASI|nr:hypothetical protein EX895_000968 [Sporisorium graminicola]TKY90969.1 hypothetical protein EX895_000968 [Sporisorium graminicola]
MQAEPSQASHAALGVTSGASPQSTSPYLTAVPYGFFASPAQSVLFDPTNQQQSRHLQQQQQQGQPPQPSFANADGSFQHAAAHSFQTLANDSNASSHDAAYRVPAIPRAVQAIDYSNPYHQLDSHMQQQQPQQHASHPVPYTHHYASTSYSALAGPSPVAAFTPDLSSHPYAHSDMGMMPPTAGLPMMRYNSFGMSTDDMSRASSSNGTPGPMTQQDIDNLLAMSRAQAGSHGDASAFPCTYCDKVYTGKHARSIWRRHLQDKHNIPLSAQPRRTRWDGDVNRPKNAEERRARMLESKRRWARKKRLQEKQAAQGGHSGSGSTPMPDDSDDDGADDGDDGADADVSSMSMSMSFSRDTDDSLPFAHVPAQANRRASLKAPEAAQWATAPEAQFFAASQEELGRPAKRQALAPSTAYNIAGPSPVSGQFPAQMPSVPFGAHETGPGATMYSSSPMRRSGLPLAPVSQQGGGLQILSNANASFSSNSSDYSQPNSASFFNDSFAGNMSNAGSDSANTSIDTPATKWPALPPLDGPADKEAAARAIEAEAGVMDDSQPRPPKGDTRDAAIQLLALRSGSNSPTDDREMSVRRRDAIEDAPWSSTPSRGKATSEHAALTALSCSSTAAETGRKGGALDDLCLSPSPISRTLASGATAVRAMPVTTPGPAIRGSDNPFSLDKHKISPYEGRRKLSYSGAPASPTASPTHLTFGGVGMDRSLSSSSAASTGVKLAPLVSTPIRPSSQGQHAADAEMAAERTKMDALPPLLGSASKKTVSAPVMSTPFSKPMAGLGYSALRRGVGAIASGPNAQMASMTSSVRPSPSRHHSDDQFSSPQHLNLTESLGLAPHSISRTSSYASACYASSLGLTPSVAAMSGGLISGTPFHSGLGALSGLGGFTPLSTAKVGLAGGVGFWPESTRKSGTKGASSLLHADNNSPTVYKSASASSSSSSASASQQQSSARASASRLSGSGKRKLSALSRPSATKAGGAASPVMGGGKGDVFGANCRKEQVAGAAPSSDDTFGDDDDDDDENLIMSIGALDTPSRPAVMRKLARSKSAAEHKLLSPSSAKGSGGVMAQERSPLRAIKLN